ncbi:MAG: ABC transporter substrate-binding protein [Acetobacteraceae bacterium]
MTITRRTLLGASAALPFLRNAAHAASPAGTLTFGLSSYPPNLQPWMNAGSANGAVIALLHRNLVCYGADGSLQGDLAEHWEADGDAWVFHLRDALFQNGEKVTADDVKWTLEQVAAPTSLAYMRSQFQNVAQIDTPDARTVRLVMKQPMVTIPEWLANYFMPIVAKGSTGPGKPGIGAGPFMLKSFERGVSLDLVAFDKYYKPGLPKLKAIRVVAYADENARVSALQAGDVDMIDYVPWQSMAAIEADPKLKLTTQNGPFMYLTFNGRSGPFKDALVRQAIGFAVNRDDIIKTAFFGRGAPMNGVPLTPGTPYYDEKYAQYFRYDPAHAKALLAQAGLADGFSCTLLSTGQYSMHQSTAEVVQQNLAAVGIQVKLALPDWATRVSLGNRGQFEFAVGGTAEEIIDPDGLTSVLDNTLSPSYIRSTGFVVPEMHELLDQGRAEFDPAKRRVIYTKVQQLGAEQAPIIGLCYRAQGYAMKQTVQGFINLPGPLTFFAPMTLDETSIA